MIAQGRQLGRLHENRLLEQVSAIQMPEWPGGSALIALSLPEGVVPAVVKPVMLAAAASQLANANLEAASSCPLGKLHQ